MNKPRENIRFLPVSSVYAEFIICVGRKGYFGVGVADTNGSRRSRNGRFKCSNHKRCSEHIGDIFACRNKPCIDIIGAVWRKIRKCYVRLPINTVKTVFISVYLIYGNAFIGFCVERCGRSKVTKINSVICAILFKSAAALSINGQIIVIRIYRIFFYRNILVFANYAFKV